MTAALCPPESECIRKDGVDVLLNSLVEGEVQAGIHLGIIISLLMVDGGRNYPSVIVLTQRTASKRACGAEQMTSHRLRGAEVDLISVRTEQSTIALASLRSPTGSGGAVKIDVIDIFRLHSGILEGVFHHETRTETFGMSGGDVVCVGTHSGTCHFGIDVRSAGLGVFELLEHEVRRRLHRSRIPSREPLKGRDAPLASSFASGESLHRIEASHSGGEHGSLGTTGHHGIGIAETDGVMRRRSARCSTTRRPRPWRSWDRGTRGLWRYARPRCRQSSWG